MGNFGLFADPGIPYLPPFRAVFLALSLKEHSPDYYTICFFQIRNRSVIFTRFVAHYVELNSGCLLQVSKPLVMTYEPPKKTCYFIDCLNCKEYNRG